MKGRPVCEIVWRRETNSRTACDGRCEVERALSEALARLFGHMISAPSSDFFLTRTIRTPQHNILLFQLSVL
jgi:hypothetical protein